MLIKNSLRKESWPKGPGFGLPLKGAQFCSKPYKLKVPKMI